MGDLERKEIIGFINYGLTINGIDINTINPIIFESI